MGISFFISCLPVTRMSGEPGCTGLQGDDVSTAKVRASILSARARHRGGRTDCLTDRPSSFYGEPVSNASLLHEIARIFRRAARRLMTGAQQISSRMRAVFVSAGWLSRTEVVKMSPTRGYMGIPSFGTGDRLWGRGPTVDLGMGAAPYGDPSRHQSPFLSISSPISPITLLEACNPWICGGFHLTGWYYIQIFLR
eukprot:CAMPEP_0201147326 /NCGR_PEP_ID=MMETSP0851-20130426/8875_1 /ASSEMBLY_ACC=CAM_ASM_000631 /TAXON_ID=183588 /ORGANISM="Pseudo-nitzschia fraudulenta, Strain WWA7" /LENGTH=195 /DNA_ID=CAMNT_0047423127 /DNA_START=436 /DNA_END=1024 /DNA_ORIENTATION=+